MATEWRDGGRRRWTLRVESVRMSKNVLLTSVFLAMMLSQLLSTTVGKGVYWKRCPSGNRC